eukprot:m.407376 g.407376  ORF g.407376 m.407376 type:complete len:111 (+) comp16798_c0_seq3:601-933(+)
MTTCGTSGARAAVNVVTVSDGRRPGCPVEHRSVPLIARVCFNVRLVGLFPVFRITHFVDTGASAAEAARVIGRPADMSNTQLTQAEAADFASTEAQTIQVSIEPKTRPCL